MNKALYRSAVNEIKPGERLLRETAEKMRLMRTSDRRTPPWKRYAFISALSFVLSGTVVLSLFYPDQRIKEPSIIPLTSQPPNVQEGSGPSAAAMLPQIADNYVPFNATEFQSVKAMGPDAPFYYEELKQNSDLILVGTVSDIGVYRNKAEQYHPKASFGTYIYTIEINDILSGTLDEAGGLIPVAERAWANPTFAEDGTTISEWSFSPYSFRPDEVKPLEKDKQYVLFLSRKDDTEVYRPSYDGFGVFPMDYIERESRKNTLAELEKQYKYVEEVSRAPLKDDLLYRLSSLYIKEQWLGQ